MPATLMYINDCIGCIIECARKNGDPDLSNKLLAASMAIPADKKSLPNLHEMGRLIAQMQNKHEQTMASKLLSACETAVRTDIIITAEKIRQKIEELCPIDCSKPNTDTPWTVHTALIRNSHVDYAAAEEDGVMLSSAILELEQDMQKMFDYMRDNIPAADSLQISLLVSRVNEMKFMAQMLVPSEPKD